MGKKVVHTSRISITREKGPVRKTVIEGLAAPVDYGVHGASRSSTGSTPWRSTPRRSTTS